MHRRQFLLGLASASSGVLGALGCRGHQYGHVLRPDQADMVGSHDAGAETFNALVADATGQLLARHAGEAREATQAAHLPELVGPGGPGSESGPKAICFVGVENKSAERIGDFKEQIYQEIDTQILESQVFRSVSKRFVDAGLRETRLRTDSLFVPDNMRAFVVTMEQMGQPFDYLLYATITSGTTENNRNYQRDYLLTMELVNVRTGQYDKQSAKIRKGYHRSKVGAITNYNPFKKPWPQ